MATLKKRKATLEDVWETINSLGEAQKQTEKAQQKTEKLLQETQKGQKEVQEAQKRTEKAQQKTEKAQQKTEESLQSLGEKLDQADGNFNSKWGRFLEDLVRGDFLNLLRDRGMDVIRVLPRVPFYRPDGNQAGDIDLLAVNGGDVLATEVKTTLTLEKVDQHLETLKKFKEYFPEYRDKTLYGGVAYLDEKEKAAKYAEEQGLFVIKSPGGKAAVSVITNAKNFRPKVF